MEGHFDMVGLKYGVNVVGYPSIQLYLWRLGIGYTYFEFRRIWDALFLKPWEIERYDMLDKTRVPLRVRYQTERSANNESFRPLCTPPPVTATISSDKIYIFDTYPNGRSK